MTSPHLSVLRQSLLRACSDQWIVLTFARAAVEQMRRSPHAIRLLVRSSFKVVQCVTVNCLQIAAGCA